MSKGSERWVSQGESKFTLLLLFVLFSQSTDWMMISHMGEGDLCLLSVLIQMLISFRSTLPDTPRNNVLPAIWASVSPVKLTHKN